MKIKIPQKVEDKVAKQEMFPDIVGQTVAKRKLTFLMRGYDATGIMPHLMFIAPKGCGKTLLAKAVGRNLMASEEDTRYGKPKRFMEINCSTIKNVKQFFNQIAIPHINRKEVTVLFDECSELPKTVSMLLLTALNPNKENRNEMTYEDFVIDIDFTKQSFIFATTEAQDVFHALMDRCDRVDLEDYTYDELAEIISLNLKGHDINFGDGVLPEMSSVLRGNARAAQKLAQKVQTYLASEGRKDFTLEDWEDLKYHLGILPLGLNRMELKILRHVAKRKECSLTNIAAATGLTTECVRRDFEMYLAKMGLMTISTAGRSLTPAGLKYMDVAKVEEKKQMTDEQRAAIHEDVKGEHIIKIFGKRM